MINEFVKLNNGVNMPLVGLGVYKILDGNEMTNTVGYALDAGYKAFDTAQMYQNEAMLGNSIQELKCDRHSIFITTKVDNVNQGYYSTLRSFENSLNRLKTDYLDLLLIHWPGQNRERCVATWQAMIELLEAHRVRAIGVSNFNERHLKWLMETGTTPSVNQIEKNLNNGNNSIVAFCKDNGIVVEAWAPVGRGDFGNELLLDIANKYNRTPAQILLRWNVQNNIVVIPKSVHKERIEENINIFSFELTCEEMGLLDSICEKKSKKYDLDVFDF